jgi:hypothetical protein
MDDSGADSGCNAGKCTPTNGVGHHRNDATIRANLTAASKTLQSLVPLKEDTPVFIDVVTRRGYGKVVHNVAASCEINGPALLGLKAGADIKVIDIKKGLGGRTYALFEVSEKVRSDGVILQGAGAVLPRTLYALASGHPKAVTLHVEVKRV